MATDFHTFAAKRNKEQATKWDDRLSTPERQRDELLKVSRKLKDFLKHYPMYGRELEAFQDFVETVEEVELRR